MEKETDTHKDDEVAVYYQKLFDDKALSLENRYKLIIEFMKEKRGLTRMSNPFMFSALTSKIQSLILLLKAGVKIFAKLNWPMHKV